MKRYLVYILIAIFIVVIAGGVVYYCQKYKKTASQSTETDTGSSSPQDNSIETSPNTAPPTAVPEPTLVYPLSDFAARITANDFGAYYPLSGTSNPDRKVCPNATYYSGYHTAVDLEVFSNELDTPVIVKSIATGTVREASPVAGYGGLIVIEYKLGGETYTAYYGHINLNTATVKLGDRVIAGENLAELGPQCSSANGDVRKHLHFGLRKGGSVDVRGYVPTQSALSNWVDPKILLLSLKAQ